jgi:hypothetical protein
MSVQFEVLVVKAAGPIHGGGSLLSLQHSLLPSDFNRVNHPIQTA